MAKPEVTDDVVEIARTLLSIIEGAPFPQNIDNELYTLWYEHAQQSVTNAQRYLNENHPDVDDDDKSYI